MKSASSVAELIGRADTLDEVCSNLLRGGAGAIILGPSGIGKSALLKAAADRLEERFHVLHIRGSAIAAQTPYGALSFLVSGLPDTAADSPLRLLQELSRLLTAQAGGRRILLAVDNADHLDRLSCMVLSQLLRRGSIAVLAAASLRWEEGDELLGLWSEGLLARIDLEPLSERQTRQLMQQILGGAVSSLAAGTMWREAAGSPRFIRLLTDAQVRSGVLVRRGTVWVRTAPFIRSGEITEVINTLLARLDDGERRLVEVLALCVSLPLPTALELVPSAVVDSLEELELVEVRGDVPRVSLALGNGAGILAESMAPGRKRRLWEEVSPRLDPTVMEPAELMAFVAWTISCGEQPAVEDAYRAAAAANHSADFRSALRFIRAVPARLRDQNLLVEEIRALHTVGDLDEALRLFREAEPGLNAGERSSYVPLLLLHARALARIPGADDPDRVLELIDASQPDDGDAPDLRASTMLVRAGLAIDRGNPGQVLTWLASLAAERNLSPQNNIHVLALQAFALAITGRAADALAVLGKLGPPAGYVVTARSSEEVSTRVFETYLLAGEFERATEFVRFFDESGVRPSTQGSAGELAEALLGVWKGQYAAAKEALTSGVGQLSVHDPRGMLPLAETLVRWISRENGQHPAGVPAEDRPALRTGYFREFQVRYFSVLAGDPDPEVRCRQLRAEAAQAHRAGYRAPALIFLSAAVRLGDREAAAAVPEMAAGVQGAFAELLTDYAAGLLAGDSARLLQAASGFARMGQHLLCLGAARTALAALSTGADDAGTAKAARSLVNSSLRRMKHVGGRAETLAELSEFEADLAHRAVTMATTTQIARELNLSPRTVEWHLGKIFAKLHVSGRAELAEVLA